ncbi:MAG: haloacid dehalogenase-like hydrolase [Gemmatimonadetes bacterium]|nr:haloacid dehalogenase-like hydrolase [Gemmatimonadota bacterium]MCC6773987.1 haloacid dehalogenase-like hydrolase [Gemmatimonadaceae bacterium]
MKLVLFDIDGTILWTDGAGRRAMEGALVAIFGTPGPSSYRYDGKTDRQIVRDLMREDGHDDVAIDARLPTVLEEYLLRLERELSREEPQVHRLDGVLELLDALESRADRVLGLLTGNVLPGAERKLRAVGIDPGRFRIGAFGSDHEHRPALPAIALERSRVALDATFSGDRLIIVGDTPADIHCGRDVGARAIAVATGHYSVDDLSAHGPAAVFADLRDTAAVMQAIDDA